MSDNYSVILESGAEKFLDSLVDEQKELMIDLLTMLENIGYELGYPYST